MGAVNVVSRSGGNDFHGSGFFFFYRDHNLAAYPGLKRSTVDPNPYFSRKNPGGYISGPIIKDKLFFFFNYEYTHQLQAVTVQPDLASLQPLTGTFASPSAYHYLTTRFDYRLTPEHSLFLRYTHDGNTDFGVPGATPVEPSAWISNNNWSDQYALGLTSTLTPNLVNDARIGFSPWYNKEYYATPAQCSTANCVGSGEPYIAAMVGSSNFTAGNNSNSPQNRIIRYYEVQDTVSWQKGSHRLKIGGDLGIYTGFFDWGHCQTPCVNVYSIETTKQILGSQVSTYLPNLPSRRFLRMPTS